MKRLALIILASGLVPLLHANEKQIPPPGLLLDKAPEMAQWTIKTKASSAAAQPERASEPQKPTKHSSGGAASQKEKSQPTDQTTTVTKTRTIRFEETVPKTGAKVQRWCLPDMQVTIQEAIAPLVAVAGNTHGAAAFIDYTKTDFPGFEWISADNFTGIEKVQGHDCLVFHGKVQEDGETLNSAPGGTLAVTAYIAAGSRLPCKLEVGDVVRTYEFGLAPTDLLILPPEVQTLVDQWRIAMQQSDLMPAKP